MANHAPQPRLDAQPERGERRPALVFVRGELRRAPVVLDREETIIGRALEADVRIDDARASRLHARLTIERDANTGEPLYRLVDLDSTNGVLVNDRKIAEAVLRDGDKITIGTHILRFELLDRIDSEYRRRLSRLLAHDELTGLLTARSFLAELRRETARAAAEDRSFCVLMMDVDRFKRVNDAHGHLAGSRTLEELGEVIGRYMRAGDVAARYGGEEFAALVRDADERTGALFAEDLRSTIEEHRFRLADDENPGAPGAGGARHHRLTISIGVAAFPQDARDPLALLEAADAALYQAKRSGRNRVCEARASHLSPAQTPTQGEDVRE